MSLDFKKVTYVDGETVIGAENLNDIQDALLDLDDNKVEKEQGKGLSTNDYSDADKSKVDTALQAVPDTYRTAAEQDVIDAAQDTETRNLKSALDDPVTGLATKAPVIIDTASGAIASFEDGADGMPIKKLVANIEPVQDLHGYDNPWPAGGGKNLFNKDAVTTGKRLDPDGQMIDSADQYVSEYIPVTVGTSYIKNSPTADAYHRYATYDSNKANVRISNSNNITIETGEAYIRMCGLQTELSTTQVEIGSTYTTYAPYSNVCPISGWTGANVTRTGKNLLKNNSLVSKTRNGVTITVNADGTISLNGTCTSWFFEQIFLWNGNEQLCPPGDYIISGGVSNVFISIYLDNDTKVVNYTQIVSDVRFTVPQGRTIKAIRFEISANNSFSNAVMHLMIRPASVSNSDYKPYTGTIIPFSWQSEAGTVYGGTLDVTSGVLTVTHTLLTKNTANMNNGQQYPGWRNSGITAIIGVGYNRWFTNQIMNIGTAFSANTTLGENDVLILPKDHYGKTQSEWIALAQDVQVYLELRNPITYQLTPTEVTALLGTNNIWADCGDTEVNYPADTKLYIDNKITQAIANALNS